MKGETRAEGGRLPGRLALMRLGIAHRGLREGGPELIDLLLELQSHVSPSHELHELRPEDLQLLPRCPLGLE